jgi:outer membrane protein assembly factor BamB
MNAFLRTVLVVACALPACSGGGNAGQGFARTWRNDGGESIARLEQEQRTLPKVPNTAVAVGVTAKGLRGAALPDGNVWHSPTPVDVVPSIAGNLVVATGGDELFALDAKSGKKVWSVPAQGRRLRGAADDGGTTVASLGGDRPGESLLLFVDRSGSVVFEAEPEPEIGVPGARGGVAFVPFGDQYVVALEIPTGREVARVLMRDLVSRTLNVGGTLYFGEQAFVRYDDAIRFASSNTANRFTFPVRQLPGNPRWLGSGQEVAAVDDSARGRIRLFALPDPSGNGQGLANGAYAVSYFRVIYAFAPPKGGLLFADALPAEAVGGAAFAAGFAFCDASGKVHLYGATGGRSKTLELGEKIRGCAVDGSSLSLLAGTSRGTLVQQIDATLSNLEPDMAAAAGLLIEELGRLPDPDVTRVLISLAQNSRIIGEQRALVRKLLAERRNGNDEMLAALGRHYDFVSGEQPPPVGPLADALAAMKETRAAPPLARHLNDPATPEEDVEHAARALETLGTPAELEELRTFFALYRATATSESLVNAVISVAATLLRVGGAEGKALVDRAGLDPLTLPEVRKALASLTAKPAAPPSSGG